MCNGRPDEANDKPRPPVYVCMCASAKPAGTRLSIIIQWSNDPLYMCLTPCPPYRVWDIQTGQVIKEILHHKGSVYSLKFTTNTLVTGSSVSPWVHYCYIYIFKLCMAVS